MKKIKIFDLKEQYKTISKEVNKNVLDILSSGQYILGKNLLKLEENFSKYVGSNYAVGCNSGTDALLLSLRAMNIGPGDEVITSPFSYFATAEVIALTGAKPVFADIRDDFNIDPYEIEKKVPERKFKGVTKKFEKVLCVSHVLNKIPTKQPKHEKKIITIIK